jgi:hypothetical protein
MSESFGTDSPLRGWTMPKAYSGDLRERVIEAVYQPECAFAVFWATRHHLQKKPAGRRARAARCSPRAATLDTRARHA